MSLLVEEMCSESPELRPKMSDVMTRYEWLIFSLSDRRLATRLVNKGQKRLDSIWDGFNCTKKGRSRLRSNSPVPPEFNTKV